MEEKVIQVEEIRKFNNEVSKAIKRLARYLGDDSQELTDEDIKEMIDSQMVHLLLAKEKENIVGMVTVIVYRIPFKKKAWLEDLVVDPRAQGKGIGKKLVDAGINLAKKENVKILDLTSRPFREAANILYTKAGFEKKETNVYRLVLS